MSTDKPRIHGALIIIGMIVFFPVGIVLLLIRFAAHSKVNHFRAQDYKLVGHSFMTLYALIGIILIASGTSSLVALLIVMAVLFALPGGIFYALSAKNKNKMNTLYTLYDHLIMAQGVDTVERLSALSGQSVRNVQQDLRYLIATGRLKATLDSSGQFIKAATLQDVMAEQLKSFGGLDPAIDGRVTSEPTNSTVTKTSTYTYTVTSTGDGAGLEDLFKSMPEMPEMPKMPEMPEMPGMPGMSEAAAAKEASEPLEISVTCKGCGSTSQIVRGEKRECSFCGSSLASPA